MIYKGVGMAKERLSKLQRWILERCYKNRSNEIWRSDILLFFGTEHPYTSRSIFLSSNSKNKAEVSITNSLKNLFKKGYIDLAVGHLGGSYILEDTNEGLLCNYKELKRLENGGKPAKFGDLICDIDYIKDLIADRKKVIEEGVFTPSIMGQNIHRLKLIDKGMELVKSLNIN
ncbi:hypothetical protein ES705_27528 [subsurface metagenome]